MPLGHCFVKTGDALTAEDKAAIEKMVDSGMSQADAVDSLMSDVDQQIDSRRDLPAATGVIDLKAFLGALVEIGYDGPIMAEPFRPDLRSLPRDKALGLVATAMKKAFALVE